MKNEANENLNAVSSASGNRAEPVEIWKARAFIHEQADEQLSLKKVARAVNVSPNYLSEKFKRVTGENFVAYINRRRVQNARELLLDRNVRISEIAFAVGFQSLSQFNRVFKKLCGQSPSDYRSTLLKDKLQVPQDKKLARRIYRRNA